ncbi:MAG TPA: DUF503 domain-containing protein [Limnochordia bacterium]|nr:DUF503 domain-containing protein [Limnochordia bacterium]
MAETHAVVGVLSLTLCIPAAHSLKDKRQVVQSLIDGLHARYRVAVAEVGDQDLHQRAVIACAVVSNSPQHVQSVLQRVLNRVESTPTYEVTASDIELR